MRREEPTLGELRGLGKAHGGTLPESGFAVDAFRPAWGALRRAAEAIRRGRVAAIPTDTVYGLAADPFQPRAVAEVFSLKRRPETLPLLLLIDSARQLDGVVAERPELFERLAAAFWPGPLTMILPAAERVPEAVTAGSGTIAVRLPAAEIPRRLARLAGPITGTSANRSGRPAALTAAEVKQQLGSRVGLVEQPLIIDGGRSRTLRPSTIVDLTGAPRVVRQGAVPAGRLERYWR